MEYTPNVLIYGLKGRVESPLGYAHQVKKETLFCFDKILLKFLSPVPDTIQRSLRAATRNLEKQRVFATLTLEPIYAGGFYSTYINPETHRFAGEYASIFSRYFTGDTVKPEYTYGSFINFGMLITEFKRVYTPRSIEENQSSATYAMRTTTFQDPVPKFEETKLITQDWSRLTNLLNNNATAASKIPRGKLTKFLHPTAAKNLFDFTEVLLAQLGFDMIVLEADTMSLAVKVYGNWGYYPLWTNDQMNEDETIVLKGDKVQGSSEIGQPYYTMEARRPFINCDSSSGPWMIKVINPALPKPPKYSWNLEKLICETPSFSSSTSRTVPTNAARLTAPKLKGYYGTFGGQRKTKNKQKRRSKTHKAKK
jgi:hypothetical protein